jgi:predicted O-methyltransferase YrrM
MTTKSFSWQTVPGWFNFDDVYEEAVASAPADRPSRFVEIGVLFAKSTLFMAELIAQSKKPITFDAVDNFAHLGPNAGLHFAELAMLNPKNDVDLALQITSLAKRGASHLDLATYILKSTPLREHVHLVYSSGQVRAESYPPASLDFVFIDALHTYEDTLSLLRAYLPRIRPGGVLAGHDYLADQYPGVVRAVKETLGDVPSRRCSFIWRKPT